MLSSGYRQGKAAGPCTESLGSESGDVGGVEIEQLQLPDLAAAAAAGADDEAGVGHGAGKAAQPQDSAGGMPQGERLLPPVMPRPAEADGSSSPGWRARSSGRGKCSAPPAPAAACASASPRKSAAPTRMNMSSKVPRRRPGLPRQRTESSPVAAATVSVRGFAKRLPAHRGASTSAPGWGYDGRGDEVIRLVVSHARLGSRATVGFGIG